jgi:hypothetical protein
MLSRILRVLGASALAATGAVHLQQYLGAGYGSIPTIGTLFLLNAIGAGIVAVGLILPVHARLEERPGELAIALLAGVGAAIALGSLVALFVSENGTLFGFHETGYRATIVAAIACEVATLMTTLPLVAVCLHNARSLAGRTHRPRSPLGRHTYSSGQTS